MSRATSARVVVGVVRVLEPNLTQRTPEATAPIVPQSGRLRTLRVFPDISQTVAVLGPRSRAPSTVRFALCLTARLSRCGQIIDRLPNPEGTRAQGCCWFDAVISSWRAGWRGRC